MDKLRASLEGKKGSGKVIDPLSPFILTVVMRVLSMMVNKAVYHKTINGFQVHPHGTQISHLQFVDDSLFFLGF